jgi:hypothetical protein
VLIPPPGERAQTVFFNTCNLPTPQQYTLVNDAGADMVFEANTQLPIVFRRGADPIALAPQAQLTTSSVVPRRRLASGGFAGNSESTPEIS